MLAIQHTHNIQSALEHKVNLFATPRQDLNQVEVLSTLPGLLVPEFNPLVLVTALHMAPTPQPPRLMGITPTQIPGVNRRTTTIRFTLRSQTISPKFDP